MSLRLTPHYRMLLLAVALSVGIGALFARAILTIRDDEWNYARDANAALARTLEQSIGRTLDSFDHSLAGVVETLARPDLAGLPPDVQHAMLFDHSLRTRGLGSVAVIDPGGNVVVSAGVTPAKKMPNLADRDYFQFHMREKDRGVYIGRPIQGRVTGEYSLAMSRAYFNQDGSFGGVVVGTIRLSYFNELFASLGLGPQSLAEIVRADGTEISRFPSRPHGIGEPVGIHHLEHLVQEREGHFTEPQEEAQDGISRLYAFRRVGDYPLVVSVAQSVESILSKWQRNAVILGTFAALLMAACIGLALLFARELARRQNVAAQLQRAQHDMRTILDNLPSLVAYWDRNLRNRFANQAYLDWLGMTQEEIQGRPIEELLTAEACEAARPYLRRALQGRRQVYERSVPISSGEVRHMMVSCIPDMDGEQAQGIFVQIDDLTERKRMEDLLFEEKELVRLTLQSIGDAVLCTDASGHVTYINPVAEKMTGWQAFHAAGRDIDEVAPLYTPNGVHAEHPARSALSGAQALPPGRGLVLFCRDGRRMDVENSVSPITDRHGQVTGTVMVLRDVTEAMALARRMAHLAQHDMLTDLPNRVLLQDRAQQAIAQARRDGHGLALMYIDLDGFKQVNDTLGHDAGDLLLVQVARRFTRCVRRSDTVCRQGGDEFIVLLPIVEHPGQACHVARKIVAVCDAPFDLGSESRQIGLSGGIALFPQHGSTFEELARSADVALYTAKRAGKQHFRMYAGPEQEPEPVPPAAPPSVPAAPPGDASPPH
ncbi:diguanylate cyclase with PAS/PAC sensor [Paracidovorax avenae ATCC 19860]|uniref:Diguanylate cyclase with PAS/PAC sensor n=1 Tax=Paracidovorax avenae (strain ATCC 19860 / DSM 7227 / CCUG 15838 / JCM 20985 / LMG 2117 / NCPPB 1011) TaxID=643561 RepID=F0Q8Y1_PARA1|nr:diguanylate cyclase [Paracidovorax avenae]ADX45912.1 diguanylate cyclase with PAS/PAC sensor [Paracidovorax avenae ATCC 19860]